MKKTIALLLVLVCVIPMFGGVLKGKVLDESGIPIAFAMVSADEGTRKAKEATTDFDGEYKIHLSGGEHIIKVYFIGYETLTETINVRGKVEKDFVLKPMTAPPMAEAESDPNPSQPTSQPAAQPASQPAKEQNSNNPQVNYNNDKGKVLSTLPLVGPTSGEFYAGHFNGKPIADGKHAPVKNREMNVYWELDTENYVIALTYPCPDGGGHGIINYWGVTFYLGNGQKITSKKNSGWYHASNNVKHEAIYAIPLLDYQSDNITISSINLPEQTGERNWDGYWTKYQDHMLQINYTLPIDVKEAKAYCLFNRAKRASLKDAVAYLKDCTNEDYCQGVKDEIVNKKIQNISDVVYCLDNYPQLKDMLEQKTYWYINSMADCETYLRYYGASAHAGVDDKVFHYVDLSNNAGDCDTYLQYFPNGSHKATVVAQKAEINCYNAAKNGGKAECLAYLKKYPNGRFATEIKNKKEVLVGLEKREAQIKKNSNKSLWKLGNKLCNCTDYGIIMVTLDQWNEDHSSFKGIVTSSPKISYNGDFLLKGNYVWFEPKNWHKCLDDEIETSLKQDKSF